MLFPLSLEPPSVPPANAAWPSPLWSWWARLAPGWMRWSSYLETWSQTLAWSRRLISVLSVSERLHTTHTGLQCSKFELCSCSSECVARDAVASAIATSTCEVVPHRTANADVARSLPIGSWCSLSRVKAAGRAFDCERSGARGHSASGWTELHGRGLPEWQLCGPDHHCRCHQGHGCVRSHTPPMPHRSAMFCLLVALHAPLRSSCYVPRLATSTLPTTRSGSSRDSHTRQLS